LYSYISNKVNQSELFIQHKTQLYTFWDAILNATVKSSILIGWVWSLIMKHKRIRYIPHGEMFRNCWAYCLINNTHHKVIINEKPSWRLYCTMITFPCILFSDVSECVIVVQCQVSNISVKSWREQISFRWNDDDVCFVLKKHA
jgi:hypothetical protein